ncbi:flagellar basal-body rod protein FlgG [Hydrogenivirga caldilitoris]|uniref:Flagellar basal-body rod protein FlgG n=1 Tax=Hydrogenivirga caldilitoris TaxID=246264 RepID=A0A497XMS4_9AQUI|nr:flagellar basal-body rod protein FlgF [Hydrogenivirga caldilitoris]RLJ70246.1 flagellar basal-body rod protein FlgG [Hydrogenivirga caldilitoris]
MALDYQPLFVLSGGMLLQERKLAVITNNLANMDTPSFKKDLLEVSSWYTDMGSQVLHNSPENPANNFIYPMMSGVFTDMSQGPLRETGNTLDLAIDGEGFFAVRTPDGIRYTRKGNFRLDREGFLVTEEGYRVLDRGNNDIQIRGSRIEVDREGNIYTDGVLSSTLGVWSLQDSQKLGEDLFVGTPQPAREFHIKQGFIELSNVNAILEMVRLIETSRAHETYARLIQAVDEVQGRVNNIVR